MQLCAGTTETHPEYLSKGKVFLWNSKNSRRVAGASFFQSAADVGVHFTDGLHGLGQILHDLHIQIPPDMSVWCVNYRVPMQAAISPIFCMVFRMFFFIVIMVTSKVWVRNVFWLAADTGQHLAVVSHVLNQILDHNVLHNKNTSKIECEKFCFYRREQCAVQPSVKVL